MAKYIIRLDDACEKMDVKKWCKIEELLDCYNIKPLVGVIPHCEDPMMDQFSKDYDFWSRVAKWEKKGWEIALHGYNHVYTTTCGGINPVNRRSEFAGESLIIQKEKIKNGISVFRQHGIEPKVFFAPSHTFDETTLVALEEESDIRIISDTIAVDSYCYKNFTFVPQQSGKVRKLPFKVVTFCYHPNTMQDKSFHELELFIRKNSFSPFPTEIVTRERSSFERLLQKVYLKMHNR